MQFGFYVEKILNDAERLFEAVKNKLPEKI